MCTVLGLLPMTSHGEQAWALLQTLRGCCQADRTSPSNTDVVLSRVPPQIEAVQRVTMASTIPQGVNSDDPLGRPRPLRKNSPFASMGLEISFGKRRRQ